MRGVPAGTSGRILAGPELPTGFHRLWISCGNLCARGEMTEVWTSILKQIEGKLDAKELKTWFGPTRQVGFVPDGDRPQLTVSVPTRVFADWIESRHGELLSREAEAAGFPGLSIRFEASNAEAP